MTTTRPLTEYLARSKCENLAKCPGTFYFLAYVGAPSCPICGVVCHPENNERNAGPALFDPKTKKAHNPWSEVTDG